jgi:hypothetical protein
MKIVEERDQVRNFQPQLVKKLCYFSTLSLQKRNRMLKEAIKEAILEGEILMNIKRLMTSC